MSNNSIQVYYNESLRALEKLLSGVRRPGNFFVSGFREMPMPKIEVEGLGVLSFPIPQDQIKRLIEQAALAPYGRGEETIIDTSVRKVWQLPLEKVEISGSSWPSHFGAILSEVKKGLGCQDQSITAKLYKMLVYEEGCFFLSHRDTEKAEGMFGTLVIVLPSCHSGGELIIRHAGHEVTVNLSNLEISTLNFAAFYADCEHEVLPIQNGNRVCLIYNLIQQPGAKIVAPFYDTEIAQTKMILKQAMKEADSPVKIAWLLEHQYTSAALAFGSLKNADAALVQVLTEAALSAGCAVHLGIVHLEETGSAEPEYDSYSRRRYYDDDDEENSCSDSFEVIEVCDTRQYIDGWINLQNCSVDFGELPLQEGELLPKGALDGEAPDEERLLGATGNEGSSFERSYRRAALVIWRQERYAEVLLQAGVGAVMPYFKECVMEGNRTSSTQSLAQLILDQWEASLPHPWYAFKSKTLNRSEMLQLLGHMNAPSLIERFIATILTREYDGSENKVLTSVTRLLNGNVQGRVLSQFTSDNMNFHPTSCVDLLNALIEEVDEDVIQKMAAAVVAALKNVGNKTPTVKIDFRKNTPIDFTFVVKLWDVLIKLRSNTLQNTAANEVIVNFGTFDPEKILVPAICRLFDQHGDSLHANQSFMQLWQHSSQFLLSRSENSPEPPKDWRQEEIIACRCEDCLELQAFVLSPSTQVYRFRVRKDRRQHLHQEINNYELDMTHVTERSGSPQTLVCTKTRHKYEQLCNQYQLDIAAMSALMPLFPESHRPTMSLHARLKCAVTGKTTNP